MEVENLIGERFCNNPFSAKLAEPDFNLMFADYPLPPELQRKGLMFGKESVDPYGRMCTEFIEYNNDGRVKRILTLYNFDDSVPSHTEITTYDGNEVNKFTSVRIYVGNNIKGSGIHFLVGEVEGLIDGLPSPTIDCLAEMLSKIKFSLVKSVFPSFELNRVVNIRHQCLLRSLQGMQTRCSHYECGNKSLYKCITNYKSSIPQRYERCNRLKSISRTIIGSRFI